MNASSERNGGKRRLAMARSLQIAAPHKSVILG